MGEMPICVAKLELIPCAAKKICHLLLSQLMRPSKLPSQVQS